MADTEDGIHLCDAAVTQAFGVLGKRWNGMIIATLGTDVSSFAALRRAVAGISDTVLSDRLSELAQAGLVSRTVENGPPVAVFYTLTGSGRRLLPIIEYLGRWASDNLGTPDR